VDIYEKWNYALPFFGILQTLFGILQKSGKKVWALERNWKEALQNQMVSWAGIGGAVPKPCIWCWRVRMLPRHPNPHLLGLTWLAKER
jgi:hypothetical protein